MRKLVSVSLSIAALVAHAAAANAVSMSVTYNLTGTLTVPIVGLISPNVTGTLNVSYANATGVTSGSTGMVFHGPATIAAGTLMAPLAFNVLGQAGITGSLAGPLTNMGPGALSSGAGNLMLPFTAMLTGMVHCSDIVPGACAGFGFPNSVAVPAAQSPAGVLSALGVGAISGLLLPAFAFNSLVVGSFQGFPIIAALAATEVSRHVVPEPTTMPLLALGLVAFALTGRRLRRR